jgi:antitoxin component YwqK of YwqJK toxin-antitoxin module
MYDDAQIGLYRDWNDRGMVTNEGLYLNDEKHGLWSHFSYNGRYVTYGDYLDDSRTGVWISRYDDIILKYETYEKGEKHGLMQRWYPNGELCCCGEYSKNGAVGPWKYYYPNGKIGASGNFTSPHRSFSCWDPSGRYIGKRFCELGSIIRFKTKDTDQVSGICLTINNSVYISVDYETDGVRQPLARWNWDNIGLKCPYFNF